jgi:hypothetical protein
VTPFLRLGRRRGGGIAGGSAGISGARPTPTLEEHEAEQRELENIKARNRLAYGKVYAYGAIGMMFLGILIADYVFYRYGEEHVVNKHDWQIPVGAIQVWLGATVVQVVGVVLVVARSLFSDEASSGA